MIVGSTRDVIKALASWRELGEFTVRREMCDILVWDCGVVFPNYIVDVVRVGREGTEDES